MRRIIPLLGLLTLIAAPTLSSGQGADGQWGTIKGTIILDGAIPERPVIKVTGQDEAECLKKGKIFGEEYVVDKETKGVKYVFVGLVDPKAINAAIPIHPDVAKNLPKKVVFDQPCCMFEPRVLGVAKGQIVEAKNSATIPHNVKIDGGDFNPNLNQIIPAGKSVEVDGWKGVNRIVPISCTIHPWMNGYVRVHPNPYFAVTDAKGNWEIKNAPAGNWNLVTWHEGRGFGPGGKMGVPVTIAGGKVTTHDAKVLPPEAK